MLRILLPLDGSALSQQGLGPMLPIITALASHWSKGLQLAR
jgi:hypothetical protein